MLKEEAKNIIVNYENKKEAVMQALIRYQSKWIPSIEGPQQCFTTYKLKGDSHGFRVRTVVC